MMIVFMLLCYDFIICLSIDYVSPPTPPESVISNTGIVSIKTNSDCDTSRCYSFINIGDTLLLWYRFETMEFLDDSGYANDVMKDIVVPKMKKNRLFFANNILFNGSEYSVLQSETGFDEIIGPNYSISINFMVNEDSERTNYLIRQSCNGGFRIDIGISGGIGTISIMPYQDGTISGTSYKEVAIDLGEKYHFVYENIEVDASSTRIKMFLNGVEVFNQLLSYHSSGGNCNIKFGGWGHGFGIYDGVIDELLLFRRILSDNEVCSLYNSNDDANIIEETYTFDNGIDLHYYGCVINSNGKVKCTDKRGISDGISPTINNLVVEVDDQYLFVEFSWENNQDCSYLIEFGFSEDDLQFKIEYPRGQELQSEHYVKIKQLYLGKVYYYKITSIDNSLETAIFEGTFETSDDSVYIPATPQKFKSKGGRIYLNEEWTIVTNKMEFEADFLKKYALDIVELSVKSRRSIKNTKKKIFVEVYDNPLMKEVMQLSSRKGKKIRFPSNLKKEGYLLEVFKDFIVIIGQDEAGAFYGIQSLLNLLRHDSSIEKVKIIDYPNHDIRSFWTCTPEINFNGDFSESIRSYIDERLIYWKINTFSTTRYMRFYPAHVNYSKIQYNEAKEFLEKRHMKIVTSMFTIRNIETLPFDYQEGWWIQNAKFTFGLDDKAYSDVPFENLLKNSNFENGLDHWEGNIDGAGLVYGNDSFEGYASLQLPETNEIYQKVYNITIGSTYYFSYHGTGGNFMGRISFYDSNDEYIVGTGLWSTDNFSGWYKWSFSYTAPTNAEYLRVGFYIRSNTANAFVDNITVRNADVSLKNVIRGDTTDIEVTNLDKTTTYQEGVDYTIIDGENDFVFDESLDSFEIHRIPSGSILSQQNILVSYDARHNYNRYVPDHHPACVSDQRLYDNYFFPSIDYVAGELKPYIINIGNDEIRSFNRDSRNGKRNLTNAELMAYYLNTIIDHALELDPDAYFMMSSDMVNR